MSKMKTDILQTVDDSVSIEVNDIKLRLENCNRTIGARDVYINNKVIISSDYPEGYDGDRTGSNIDHIWHDEVNNRWNLCSSTTYKALGNTTLKVKKIVPTSESWTTPTLLNSWVDYGGNFAVPRYYKDASGTVFIQGLIKSGTIDSAIFSLPAGYRPGATLMIEVDSSGHVGDSSLRIYNSGSVLAWGGSNSWFSIVASFKAEA